MNLLQEQISKSQVNDPDKTGLRTIDKYRGKEKKRSQGDYMRTSRCSGEDGEWNWLGAEPSYSSSSANGEDGGSGEDAGVRRNGGGAVCAKGVPRSIGAELVIGRGARGGGDGVRGKTRLRRDGEMTRERRTGGRCCISAAGCVTVLGSTGREELKRGCARRARSAAATSSRVVEGLA